jgi:hypothetical protein
MSEHLRLDIRRQPDDSTCGPTCLHAVYGYFGDQIALERLIGEIPSLAMGGTLGVMLANHALRRGYRATLHTYNLQVFDPTWFEANGVDLAEKLRAQIEAKDDLVLREVCRAYLEFVELGGKIDMRDLTTALLRAPLKRRLPVLTGLSSTFLYRDRRELPSGGFDDVRGLPAGHFVVLSGYDTKSRRIYVTDPLHPNPLAEAQTYALKVERVIGAILLGVLTHDANLLVLEPAEASRSRHAHRRRR